MSHWKGSVFIGPNQFTAFECLSSWLYLALYSVDCHFPKTDFFETCGSLEFSFIPPPPGCHESPAEVLVTARHRWRGAPHVSCCVLALGLLCSGLRQNWVVPLGMWMEWEDHILCCSPRRGTENLLLNSAALYNWF